MSKEASALVGYASLSRWSERRAYEDTAETSFFVKSEFRGRGVGRQLKEAIIAEARRLKFHSLIARVAQGSEESLHLNLDMGFVLVGTLREVGCKFGKRLGTRAATHDSVMLHRHSRWPDAGLSA